jgi:ABC-type transport system involved in multi-copper enzyme maturation permease subunit
MIRLARRGQAHRGRLLVTYLLLIGVILIPVFWFEWHDNPVDLFVQAGGILEPAEAGRFARRVAVVLMEATLLAVAAMTPGYAAIAIADEKERQTLPLLLTTALSDREIVLGKAAARFVFVVVAAFAALPVLSVSFFMGGVEPELLLVGYGLITGTAVLCSAIGVYAASIADDVRGAIVGAYGGAFLFLAAIPVVVFSPFGVLAVGASIGGDYYPWAYVAAGLGYPLVQFLISLGLFKGAIKQVRREDPKLRPPPKPKFILRPASMPAAVKWERPHSTGDRPKISDANPLLWKERFVGRRSNSQGRALSVLFAGLALLLIVLGGGTVVSRWLDGKPPGDDEGGRVVMTGGVLLAGLYLFPAALTLSSTVARERRRNTLESLLSLPFDRRRVLRTKVRAAVERGSWWAPVAVAAAGFAFGADGGGELGAVAAGFVLAGGWFVIALGALLTVRTKSEVQAFRFLVPAVVVVVGAPVAVWNSIPDWQNPFAPTVELAAGALGLVLVGAVLWRCAGRALDRLSESPARAGT